MAGIPACKVHKPLIPNVTSVNSGSHNLFNEGLVAAGTLAPCRRVHQQRTRF